MCWADPKYSFFIKDYADCKCQNLNFILTYDLLDKSYCAHFEIIWEMGLLTMGYLISCVKTGHAHLSSNIS